MELTHGCLNALVRTLQAARDRTFASPKAAQVANNHRSICAALLRMRSRGVVSGALALIAVLVLCAPALADGLTGKVVNATTQKPASGDEVILFNLSGDSMKETIRTRTDGSGRFSLLLAYPQGTHLVRIVHQGVTYDHTVQSGAKTVAVEVYDVTSKLEGVNAIMDVERFEATADRLEIKQLITMRNTSRPPRTLMSDRSFEFWLPPEAQVHSVLIQIEDRQPLREKPIPGERKGEYYFRYPLRPGDTRFAVVYQLPYDGEALIEPKMRDPQERFVVMLPKSMRFEPQAAGVFRPMPDVSPDSVLGTTSLTPGQTVAFRIFGTGVLAELQASRQRPLSSGPPGQSSGLTRFPKPSGPLPMSRHPLQNNDSSMLIGITVALAVGMMTFLWKRKRRKRPTLGVAREPKSIHSQQLQPRRDRQGTRFQLR